MENAELKVQRAELKKTGTEKYLKLSIIMCVSIEALEMIRNLKKSEKLQGCI